MQVHVYQTCLLGRTFLHQLYKAAPDQVKAEAHKFLESIKSENMPKDLSSYQFKVLLKPSREDIEVAKRDYVMSCIARFAEKLFGDKNEQEAVKKYLQYRFVMESSYYNEKEKNLNDLQTFISTVDINMKSKVSGLESLMQNMVDSEFASSTERQAKLTDLKKVDVDANFQEVEKLFHYNMRDMHLQPLIAHLQKLPENPQEKENLDKLREDLKVIFKCTEGAVPNIEELGKRGILKTIYKEVDYKDQFINDEVRIIKKLLAVAYPLDQVARNTVLARKNLDSDLPEILEESLAKSIKPIKSDNQTPATTTVANVENVTVSGPATVTTSSTESKDQSNISRTDSDTKTEKSCWRKFLDCVSSIFKFLFCCFFKENKTKSAEN